MAKFWAFVLFFHQVWMVVGQSYPACSTACIVAAVPSTCNSTDSVCICQQVDQSSFLSCLASSCDCADQQTAAASFGSACASDGVPLTLNVACSAASTSIASSSDTVTTSSSVTSTSPVIATSTVYSAPASSISVPPTQAATQAVSTIFTTLPEISTSTAVVVFSGDGSTITTLLTSTHWYTPTPSSSSSSSSTSSYPVNSPTATTVGFTQGSLIHHGLATGAKAGIGAGVGAAVVAVIVFSTWLLWFCRRKRRRTSSVADSEHYQHSYQHSLAPDVLVGGAGMVEKRRLSELPSETTSRKQAFSWGTSALSDSSHHRAPSSEEGVLSHHSVSAESGGQHSPPMQVDLTYQRPVLGNDGYWHQAQELQGEFPGQGPAVPAPATAPDGFQAAMYVQKVHSRPVVPPGKWRPHQGG